MVFPPGNRCQVISMWGSLNQPAQMLMLVWVLVFFEDLQGTSNFRFLVGSHQYLVLRMRAGGHSVFALSYLSAVLHTEGTSTRVCLSLVGNDAAQASVLAGLEPGGGGGASLVPAQGQPWQALCAWGLGVRLSQASASSPWDGRTPLCVCGGFV